MTENCENCKHIRELKHNFNRGFEISHCCIVLAKEGGFVIEVTNKDMCEMFERRRNEHSGHHNRNDLHHYMLCLSD